MSFFVVSVDALVVDGLERNWICFDADYFYHSVAFFDVWGLERNSVWSFCSSSDLQCLKDGLEMTHFCSFYHSWAQNCSL